MNLGSAPRKRGGFRLLTNLYMEKQYVKLHNNSQASVFAISNRGAGGEAPCKKKRCHPEGTSADVWCPKDLVLTELFLGQRGAITMKSAVNYRIILTKCFVRTF